MRDNEKHANSSVREVEVIVSVVIVLTLSEERSDKVEGEWYPGDSHPDSDTEIHNPSLDEESFNTTVKEMEKPLLGGIRSVMPDVTTSVRGLLIEILLTVPSSPLLLRNSKSLTECKAHVFGVSLLVMSKTSSYLQLNKEVIYLFLVDEVMVYIHAMECPLPLMSIVFSI